MNYPNPAWELSEYLLQENVVENGKHFTPYTPAWNELPDNINTISQVAEVNITSNPVWLRDEVTVQFNVRGRTRNDIDEVTNLAWKIYNHLLGITGFDKGNYFYGRFLANSAPTMNRLGYNTEIFASFSMSFIREGLVNEGNRIPLE